MPTNQMLIIFGTLFLSCLAFAATGGDAHHAGEIPASFKYQVLNFTIFAIALAFIIRKYAPPALAKKRADYLAEMKKASIVKEQAETERNTIRDRLAALKANTLRDLEQARVEANDVEKHLIADAQEVEKRLLNDAAQTERIDRERASNGLREKLIFESVARARTQLKEQLAENDLHRLQSEFADKIQVVRQ